MRGCKTIGVDCSYAEKRKKRPMIKIVKTDPSKPDPLIISEAALLIKRGGVVAFPTETLYGLGVNALSEKALLNVFRIKGRDYGKPIPMLIDKKENLMDFVSHVPEKAERLMEKFWPGGLTIIFRASSRLPPILTGNTGKIGVRISSNTIAQAIVREAAAPITATSANISGEKSCTTALQVYKSMGDRVDLIIDGGETGGDMGSTIIDITCTPPGIIREGVIGLKELKEYL